MSPTTNSQEVTKQRGRAFSLPGESFPPPFPHPVKLSVWLEGRIIKIFINRRARKFYQLCIIPQGDSEEVLHYNEEINQQVRHRT